MSEALEAWPVLPISLISVFGLLNKQWDNRAAALELEHYNHICEIHTMMDNSHWERFTEAMGKPFPALTDLEVWTPYVVPVLSKSFLSGSAPHL
jgi:hypothetical protein